MIRFSCLVSDPRGSVFETTVEAASEGSLLPLLEARRLTLLSSKVVPDAPVAAGSLFVRDNPWDRYLFARVLSVMIAAGVPLPDALLAVESRSGGAGFRQVVAAIRGAVVAGDPFSRALSGHPGHFPEAFVAAVEAGESAGALPRVLAALAVWERRTILLRTRVTTALVHPGILGLVAFAVLAFLIGYIVPSFEEIFRDFKVEMPPITAWAVGLSRLVKDNLGPIVAVLLAGALSFLLPGVRVAFGALAKRIAFRLPLLSTVLRNAALARYCTTLALLQDGGVPLPRALGIAQGTMDDPARAPAFRSLQGAIEGGVELSTAFARAGADLEILEKLVRAGEGSGTLPEMLRTAADLYEEDLDRALGLATAMLEPALMLFLGLVVGGIVLSIFLPILSLGAAM